MTDRLRRPVVGPGKVELRRRGQSRGAYPGSRCGGGIEEEEMELPVGCDGLRQLEEGCPARKRRHTEDGESRRQVHDHGARMQILEQPRE